MFITLLAEQYVLSARLSNVFALQHCIISRASSTSTKIDNRVVVIFVGCLHLFIHFLNYRLNCEHNPVTKAFLV